MIQVLEGDTNKINETHKNKEINILINFDKVIEEITQLHKGTIHNCREFLTVHTRYVWIVGGSRSGKTNVLMNMIIQ